LNEGGAVTVVQEMEVSRYWLDDTAARVAPSASFREVWTKFTVAACATAASQIHPVAKQTVFIEDRSSNSERQYS
jgi:hypothetical protein